MQFAGRCIAQTAETRAVEARQKVYVETRGKIFADPEFREVVIAQERDANAKLIIKAHNIDMTPSGSFTAITIKP